MQAVVCRQQHLDFWAFKQEIFLLKLGAYIDNKD
jgi:hypothetical protein